MRSTLPETPRPNAALRAATALLALVLVAACSRGQSAESAKAAQTAPVPVTLGEVVVKNVPIRAEGVGNVEAQSTVAVKSRVDGQIVRVHFRDGDEVKQGQVLFEIDSRPLVAQLRQAEAKLAGDQALLARAREQDARYQELLQKNFISPDFYSQIKSNLDAARAALEADRAALENARLQVEYATIRAPISGRAGRITIQQGNLVKANDTAALVTINQVSPIYVSVAVPEQYLGAIRAAMKSGPPPVEIVVTAADGTQQRTRGSLAFIDNTVDPTTGTIRLRASVPNGDGVLWAGQFVQAAVTLGEQADALVVPSEAVLNGPRGPYVFVLDANAKAPVRDVAVDRVAGRETLIARGLAPGERVVIDGQSRLLPGSPVKVAAPRKAS